MNKDETSYPNHENNKKHKQVAPFDIIDFFQMLLLTKLHWELTFVCCERIWTVLYNVVSSVVVLGHVEKW